MLDTVEKCNFSLLSVWFCKVLYSIFVPTETKLNKYMTIPKDLLEKWHMYRSHGDVTAIAEKAGVTNATVSNVFRVGRANDELFAIMADFYSDKEEKLSSYLSDYQE